MENAKKFKHNERVQFRLIVMPCCASMFCWVNPRFPNYCPECGTFIYPRVKEDVRVSDLNAQLSYEYKP